MGLSNLSVFRHMVKAITVASKSKASFQSAQGPLTYGRAQT